MWVPTDMGVGWIRKKIKKETKTEAEAGSETETETNSDHTQMKAVAASSKRGLNIQLSFRNPFWLLL